ncbi:arylsulfatase A [Prosthecobacter fusiformis]|uniref:Arylsulfatase A n=1 Tax=Prosthecobacter fusiformis TaxID=48464 RepID=A0A4R7RYS2_9BACT|nr:sulfatase [Prosthecobacter fusiformis]TDU71080.1 arylsulfatase A [Prosthecobacter fusiformis]
MILRSLLFSALLLAPWAVPAAEKPNLILINIDDLGYADIGPFGSSNATPNLDRMAAEGMKLTSHYAAPVCSPSRASLLTGCYPKRVLPIPHVLFPAAAVGLSPDETTIAEVLKEAGYKTACVGKWHVGDQPEFLPTAQGFDSYYGIPYSNDMGPPADGSKSNPGKPLPEPKGQAKKKAAPVNDETGLKGAAQPPLPLLENNNVIERVKAEEQFTVTQRYTDKVCDIIRQNKDGPFFIYMPHTAVHFPLYPAKNFMGKSPNGLIGDWAQEVDSCVGQVLDLLRELKLDKDTLVVFTSDNGGALNHGSNNKPLRGSKGQTFEGGIRVCTVVWAPGKIKPGTQTEEITSHMDWLPTFVSLAGGKLPERKIDGKDLSPVFMGAEGGKGHDVFYYYRGFKMEAVRSGPWKLHLDKGELYHLGRDIAEEQNIAAKHPEEVQRLRTLVEAMKDDLGLDGAEAPGVRPLGRVAKAEPLIHADGTVRAGFDGIAKKLP